MGHKDLSSWVRRFKRVLRKDTVNALGRDVRFSQRERVITPYRLAMSLLSACATMRVESLADVQRCFNALFGVAVAYKPFHNQLAKWRFGDFMRALVEMMLEHWVVRVLHVEGDGAFSEFRSIVIQDGSSFALKKTLAQHYPGRFKQKGPSAVELHVTMDLLGESLSQVTLTADTAPERAQLPAAHTLCGSLLLADRGYFDIKYFNALDQADAGFVIRGYTSINPTIVDAYSAQGKALRKLCGKALQEASIPKRGFIDLYVQWNRAAKPFRLIASWNAKRREYRYLVTNLPRERYSAEQIASAYRLRWQIELLFKEWKSYANLKGFDTSNPGIAEGMIWAAIAAAMMKRFLAHMTQHLRRVEISTRKVAMCAHHVLDDIINALIGEGAHKLQSSLQRALEYLATNATRAHPKRDRQSGRLKIGLEPVFGCA